MCARSARSLLPVLALLCAAPAPGGETEEATHETLVSSLTPNRRAMVAVNLRLEDAEAVAFWPVYDRYEEEREALGERLLGIIEDYTAAFGDMSDEKAKQIVESYLEVEQGRAALRHRYLQPFSAVLPARKVLRFYPIENEIDAVLRYELASTIPVIAE